MTLPAEHRMRLRAELVTLPDSTSATPPIDGEIYFFLPYGHPNWASWQAAGGQFQTENNGPTGLPDTGTISGSWPGWMSCIYEFGLNRWVFYPGG